MPFDDEFLSLPFLEAIEWLRQKLNMPSRSWRDVLDAHHEWAFTVAGMTKAEMLQDVRGAIDKAISEGTTLNDFRKTFDEVVERSGWSYNGTRAWRTQTIFRTNLSTAYAAGRYRQMTEPQVLSRRPYWLYRHGDPVVPREQHLAWDGLVLPADDPWWEAHYPPNGYGCTCRAFSLSRRDLEARGLSVAEEAPDEGTYEWTNPDTGEVRDIPKGVDPGFAYAPGASLREDRDQILQDLRAGLDPDLRGQVDAEIAAARDRTPDLEE